MIYVLYAQKDLHNCMIVELRNGMRYVIHGENLVGRYGDISLDCYNHDLNHKMVSDLDIIRLWYSLESLAEIYWERSAVDWSKLPIDTPLLINGTLRYFAGVDKLGYILYYDNGKKSYEASFECTALANYTVEIV